MQHRLVLGLDGGGVAQDEDLGDEFPVDFGRGVGVGVEFGQDDHALADVFAADTF